MLAELEAYHKYFNTSIFSKNCNTTAGKLRPVESCQPRHELHHLPLKIRQAFRCFKPVEPYPGLGFARETTKKLAITIFLNMDEPNS